MKKHPVLITTIISLLASQTVFAGEETDRRLHSAISGMDEAAVADTLQKGADASQIIQGRSMLGWAAVTGNAAIIRRLLAAGADPDAADQGGLTPLMLAITMYHTEAVAALLEKPQDFSRPYPGGKPLGLLAVETGKPEIVRLLLDAGVDFSVADEGGTTPALAAVEGIGGDDGRYAIIDLLGKKKVDFNRSNAAYTPLYYAVEQGNIRLVEAVLAAGADPNATTKDGGLPLKAAIGNVEILKLLLKAGAKPDAVDAYGDPVIFAAIGDQRNDALEALLQAGADPARPDKNGRTPLEYARSMFYQDSVDMLVKHGAGDAAADSPAADTVIEPSQPPKNEFEAIPRLEMVQEFAGTGSGVVYFSGASLQELVAFYRKELPAKSWSVGDVGTDGQSYANIEASRGSERLTVSLGVESGRQPARVMVNLTPHGTMKVPSLPRYPGSTPLFEQDAVAIYVTADPLAKVTEETQKLLQGEGWQGKQVAATDAMRHWAFTKDGSELTVMVSVAPAQGNKTTIQYSLQLK